MQLLNKRIAKSKNSHVAYFGIYIEQPWEGKLAAVDAYSNLNALAAVRAVY